MAWHLGVETQANAFIWLHPRHQRIGFQGRGLRREQRKVRRSPELHVYVTNIKNGTVSVISGRTNAVTATIRVGNGPVGVAVSPLTGAIYVTNIGDVTVSVISG